MVLSAINFFCKCADNLPGCHENLDGTTPGCKSFLFRAPRFHTTKFFTYRFQATKPGKGGTLQNCFPEYFLIVLSQ